jgi:catechol 2,3-dioxygenase-like lactoylglutathione lyase family enzyme
MAHNVSPDGSPLSVAIIGIDDLDRSIAFYRDVIGLDADRTATWAGAAFERLWHLPKGATASAVFCHAGTSPVGRVLLIDFKAGEKKRVRANKEPWHYGLSNLNFYTADIRAAAREIAALGYEFWSEPIAHKMAPDVGTPVEVVFEGPDGVLINLVELATADPKTQIGKMRAYVEQHGRTRRGFTPVVTSHHVLKSRDKGIAFYRDVLHMAVHIDQELSSPEVRKFLRLGEGKVWSTFVIGNHMFGKVATSHPLNFTPPDTVPRAEAPNVGYLAQAFVVSDLDRAQRAATEVGAELYSDVEVQELPGIGARRTMMVRNPGSGALQMVVAAQ